MPMNQRDAAGHTLVPEGHCCECYAKDLAYEHEPLTENAIIVRATDIVTSGSTGAGTTAAHAYLEAYFDRETSKFKASLQMPKWDKP